MEGSAGHKEIIVCAMWAESGSKAQFCRIAPGDGCCSISDCQVG